LAVGAGSAVSLAAAQPRKRRTLLVLAAVACPLAATLLTLGLEPMLVKYDRAFSALQFLLSASRDSYATGAGLAVRAALAGLGFVCIVALVQWPRWRALAQEGRPQAGRA
jgi:cytochrome c-type biogenesis protein CcmH/NrfG